MLVIFPFEEPFYREHGVEAEYVGHPLADLPAPAITREDFAKKFNLDPSKQWIGLLPGSRRSEVKFNLQTMAQAAEQLGTEYEFVLPVASTLDPAWVRGHLPPNGTRITLVEDARAALKHVRASVVASGTATVEAALIGNPFVVVYRLSRLTYAMLRRMVKLPFPYVAMANLIAERQVVPELLQSDFTAPNVVAHLRPLLADSPERSKMMQGLAEIRQRLHISGSETAIERTADAIWKVVTNGVDVRQKQ
jgi:lipid-A-disaccharide synthase